MMQVYLSSGKLFSMPPKLWFLGLVLAFGTLFVGGCKPANSGSDFSETADIPPQNDNETDAPLVTGSPIAVTPVDLSQFPDNPVVGQVPEELLDEILADLATRVDDTNPMIQVIRAQAVTWNDGSLGCPQPGVFYTQALVDGYWVVLQFDGVDYDYRASESGHFTLCEGKGGLPISPPGDVAPKE